MIKNEFAKAGRHLEIASRLDTNNFPFWLCLCTSCLEMKDTDTAGEMFDEALKYAENPFYEDVIRSRKRALAQMLSDTEGEEAMLLENIEKSQDSAYSYGNCANFLKCRPRPGWSGYLEGTVTIHNWNSWKPDSSGNAVFHRAPVASFVARRIVSHDRFPLFLCDLLGLHEKWIVDSHGLLVFIIPSLWFGFRASHDEVARTKQDEFEGNGPSFQTTCSRCMRRNHPRNGKENRRAADCGCGGGCFPLQPEKGDALSEQALSDRFAFAPPVFPPQRGTGRQQDEKQDACHEKGLSFRSRRFLARPLRAFFAFPFFGFGPVRVRRRRFQCGIPGSFEEWPDRIEFPVKNLLFFFKLVRSKE